MTGKRLLGFGWLSLVLCVGACNSTDKSSSGDITAKLGGAKPPAPALLAMQASYVPNASPVAAKPGGSDTAPFLGTWTTSAASRVSNCGSDTAITDLFGTSITWSAGAAGHIQAELVGKCVLDATVNGTTANAADQTCNDNGLSYVVGGTFTLRPDGTAQFAEHARVSGRSMNCNGTLTGPFQKFVPAQP